jgi:hypothetical protein
VSVLKDNLWNNPDIIIGMSLPTILTMLLGMELWKIT